MTAATTHSVTRETHSDNPTRSRSTQPGSSLDVHALARSVVLRVGTNTSKGMGWFGFTDPFTSVNSSVVASIHEIDGNGSPVRGSAALSVLSVIPGNGRLDVSVWVQWDSPLPWRVTFFIGAD